MLVIDDAQWADADSLTLLADLMRPPDAPPLLLVMTARAVGPTADPSPTDAARRPTLANTMQWDVRRIALSALPPDDARALATELLARAGVTDSETAASFARQAGGHPFFIDMMIRQADRLAPLSETLGLEDVIWSMVEQLDSAPRLILETVAVAEAPMAQEAVARATAVDRDTFVRAVSLVHCIARHLRGRAAVLAAAQTSPSHPWTKRRLLAHARRDARWLRRADLAYSGPWAALLEAGIASVEGDRQQAATLLQEAIEGLDAIRDRLTAAAARIRLGRLQGQEGRALAESGAAVMRKQEVVDPLRMAAALVPGFDHAG